MSNIRITIYDEYLSIRWDPMDTTNYWYAWLYDNAPDRWHTNGQKLSRSLDVDLAIKPSDLRLTEQHLFLTWEKETTSYPLNWLKQYASGPQVSKPSLWAKRVEFQSYDFQQLSDHKTQLLQCLQDIKTFGFARITEVPIQPGTVLDLVGFFGYVRETNYGRLYDVIAKKEPENLADTALGLAPHTDNPYRYPTPTIQVLHCLQADVDGGMTILIDGFFLAEKIKAEKPEYYQLLSTQLLKFKYETSEFCFENSAPVFGTDVQGNLNAVKFNNRSVQPFQLPDESMLPYYQAYQYFERLLQDEAYQERFKLMPGEAIIFDNERILHGRTAYKLLGQRHLQGCYADCDTLFSRISVLEKELGYE